jgi:hypothetical protein
MAGGYLLGDNGSGTPIDAFRVIQVNPNTGATVPFPTQDNGANRVVLYNAAGNPLVIAAGSDGRALSELGLLVDARSYVYQGTNEMLMRGNANGEVISQLKEVIPITNTGAAGAAVTLTTPTPAAGKFAYLVYLQIVLYATAAMTGGATPILVPTTNLPNTPVFTFPTALAIGTTAEQKYEGAHPIKGTAAATAITVVAPIATSGLWRLNGAYFIA